MRNQLLIILEVFLFLCFNDLMIICTGESVSLFKLHADYWSSVFHELLKNKCLFYLFERHGERRSEETVFLSIGLSPPPKKIIHNG